MMIEAGMAISYDGGFITIPKDHILVWGIDRQHRKRYRFQTQL